LAGHVATAACTDWATPANVVRAVHVAFGGRPELDPCSNRESIVRARHNIRPPRDGLEVDWSDYATVYVNPPFGRGLAKWVGKCLETQRRTQIILLLPAAVDTEVWHESVWKWAPRVCFFKGRLRFLGAKASAPMACAAAYFGFRPDLFEAAFQPLGRVVTP